MEKDVTTNVCDRVTDHCKVDVKQRHDRSDGVSYYPMVGQNLLRVVIFFVSVIRKFPVQYAVLFQVDYELRAQDQE